ncbi:MAG: DUF1033 family protein [Lactobacillales bacterium]|jgi:hypothetical protein|nr:DUF1033 family protein [Lactobacillales bacterium]
MYKVVEMYGDNEPWWFFEGWESDVIGSIFFETLEEAVTYYNQRWKKMHSAFHDVNSKKNFLAAFWTDGEVRWCEECNEYLQQYHGLALLENNQAISEDLGLPDFQKMTSHGKAKGCSLKNCI